jgi:hypothetical protein
VKWDEMDASMPVFGMGYSPKSFEISATFGVLANG